MGKHEPMTAKAIAKKIKEKGLQKIKYYCEMCKKQCRDKNGFDCHIMSESHLRQAQVVCQNPEKFIGEFSDQLMEGFMYLVRTRYRSKRILANTVFQEYIKVKEHVHLNATRWTSLTEFAEWLGEKGLVKVDYSERGVMITYIDRDPETLRRKELEEKRAKQAKEAAVKRQQEIDRQRELADKLYKQLEKEKPPIEPVPIVTSKILSTTESPIADPSQLGLPSTSEPKHENDSQDHVLSVEKPLFKIQSVAIKTTAPSVFKPPAPKKKVIHKDRANKKLKTR